MNDKIDKLLDIICAVVGVEKLKLVQPKKVTKRKATPAKTPRGTREVSEARRIASYFLVRKMGLTLWEAYYRLYPKNSTSKQGHTSIIHLLHTHEDLMQTEESYRSDVTQITALYDKAFPDLTRGAAELEWAGLGCA